MAAIYADVLDLELYGLPGPALASLTSTQKEAALQAASAVAEGYITTANPAPLTAWGEDLRRAVVHIAVYDLLSVRGFNPDGSDAHIERRYENALRWLRDVAYGIVKPTELVPADNLGIRVSSGNPDAPTEIRRRLSDDWGDFG